MAQWFSTEHLWLGRWVFERVLALTYLSAFVAVLTQFRPLLGEHGLLPVPRFLARSSFRRSPSIFHLRFSDRLVALVGWLGVIVAGLLLLGLPQAAPIGVSMAAWLLLWVMYLSIVNVGQTFYSFGWETLLVEAGFLAVFLGNAHTTPPVVVMWLLRFLLFRLEFGAGLIKMRGDTCWRDLTCLDYHHETQPMPNRWSRAFHLLPRPLHRIETFANHVTQLVVPWLLFAPQPIAAVAAIVIAVTQGWLTVSGNFAWLNFVTIGLALSVVDGRVYEWLLPIDPPSHTTMPLGIAIITWIVAAVLLILSYRPMRNLFSPRQAMNASFDSLRLVNSYGAFGSVTRARNEIVVEGTLDTHLDASTTWLEYEFKGKPGDVNRRPRQFAPYHLRLDWLMWFAAISPAYARDWFGPFVDKLLRADPATLKLLAGDPFDGNPPTYVRARLYRYRFSTRAERRTTGAWWQRSLLKEFTRPVGRVGAP